MKISTALPVAVSIILLFNPEGLATAIKASHRMSGFSEDNRHYIYLESSRNPVTEIPTAQIQIIDIENNACVRDGCLETEYDRKAYSTTNRAAEDDLLNKTSTLRHDLRLNRLKVGIQLPIIERKINRDYPPRSGITRSETVSFRVKEPTKPLFIRLDQKYIPSALSGGFSGAARTSMRLVINYNYYQLTLGDLNYYRDAVTNYAIREVRLSPNRDNIVVLIDMSHQMEEGILDTTFVQSFPLPQ
ncbi:MAG TPA: hypothetical protein DEG17_03240 [Cyanobacteria bacterium UBA11149]|nr:hypothetical protein [Cyanobacteria bacterium UBA11367]HBE56454.1 hypothetical protein [Cyanobacteria bacterium UBA11366]HBK65596.1 hypothetical protein [Cyanobacteria bacterium UBA11166]HBR74907.1 hypothetical protein [Cyanobacteria bacterium UBA11159]HBS69629.1 hypothetical protein [Cyanobacteria bacterium UBA11153]HBW87921.1 hypothetical protein [Cyanobacteria bacterium UBA11149]HCA96620.1 hypothetical protein [Cyanobacteria bacterium UBA9226]